MTDEQRKAAVEKAANGIWDANERRLAVECAQYLGYRKHHWQDANSVDRDLCLRDAEAALDSVDYFPAMDVVEAAGRFFNGSFTTHDPETRNAWRDMRGALAKVQP